MVINWLTIKFVYEELEIRNSTIVWYGVYNEIDNVRNLYAY